MKTWTVSYFGFRKIAFASILSTMSFLFTPRAFGIGDIGGYKEGESRPQQLIFIDPKVAVPVLTTVQGYIQTLLLFEQVLVVARIKHDPSLQKGSGNSWYISGLSFYLKSENPRKTKPTKFFDVDLFIDNQNYVSIGSSGLQGEHGAPVIPSFYISAPRSSFTNLIEDIHSILQKIDWLRFLEVSNSDEWRNVNSKELKTALRILRRLEVQNPERGRSINFLYNLDGRLRSIQIVWQDGRQTEFQLGFMNNEVHKDQLVAVQFDYLPVLERSTIYNKWIYNVGFLNLIEGIIQNYKNHKFSTHKMVLSTNDKSDLSSGELTSSINKELSGLDTQTLRNKNTLRCGDVF